MWPCESLICFERIDVDDDDREFRAQAFRAADPVDRRIIIERRFWQAGERVRQRLFPCVLEQDRVVDDSGLFGDPSQQAAVPSV